jgi:HipA-like protein
VARLKTMGIFDTIRKLRSSGRGRPARFELKYSPPSEEPVTVGFLEFAAGQWTFRYDDAYKGRRDLRPIEGFDDLNKEYRSSVLFPFFAIRVPNTDRDDVKEKLRQDHISDPTLTDLLRIFGRRVVSSPAFELVPS